LRNEQSIFFHPFRLDPTNECLWKGTKAINLRPKVFAVLDYLLSRPERLVTKEELLNAVWPETFVGEAVLKVAVRQIREALGDDPKSPRFIETAHRRGYRFIGPIEAHEVQPKLQDISVAPAGVASGCQDFRGGVVGRDEALSRMDVWLEKMLRGERQIVFVTGEAGIGKTALVDTFVRRIATDRNIRIGRGQCLEQYGTSEAYLPILEAIGRLGRDQRQVAEVLRAHAPLWLLQLPALVTAADRDSLNREVVGATRERMLREMGDAIETLTAEMPLVLLLEDLHWSDYSTLDLISYLARQRQAARLIVIGTYRTAELLVSGHPLQAVKRDLLARQQCEELPLEYLSPAAVGKYLSVRFPGNRFPAVLPDLIHQRTEGNPLFMVNAVDYLVGVGLIRETGEGWQLAEAIEQVEVGVPDSIKQMIERQIEHLNADQLRTLEAASVAGAEFTTLAVAAGLAEDPLLVERRCDALARMRQFIHDCGVQFLPDGTPVSRYGFIHTVYQNLLYERTSNSLRLQLHRRIGEQAETSYGERAREIAAELAMHFERGGDYRRAVEYLQKAADNEIHRFAYHQAVTLSRRGLDLLNKLPATPERDQQELCLQITLGMPLIATEGYAASDVGIAYLRARELCRQLGETPEISQVLWGLWTFYTLSGELWTARMIAEEFLRLSEILPYDGLAMRGHWAMEITFMHLGVFHLSIDHFDKALSIYSPERHVDDAFRYAQNPGVAMRCFAAWSLWFLGRSDEALARIHEALTLARELSEPHGVAHALFFAATLHQLRRDTRMAQEYAEAAIQVSIEHGLVLYHSMAMVIHGWALANQQDPEEAIKEIQQGLAKHNATGTGVLQAHFMGLLADALGKAGKVREGLQVLEQALTIAYCKGERYYEAELIRLKGELLLLDATDGAAASAYTCFAESIEISQRQKALSLELRAAMSLARLYHSQTRPDEAHDCLTHAYSRLTEGLDTMDAVEARDLIEKLVRVKADVNLMVAS
jgi:DNA-binding winged helix-turn-helix (wHTH) protein/predicted ATPase